jgi:hypothetical protein
VLQCLIQINSENGIESRQDFEESLDLCQKTADHEAEVFNALSLMYNMDQSAPQDGAESME